MGVHIIKKLKKIFVRDLSYCLCKILIFNGFIMMIDKLNSLVPILVLIIGNLINHVYRDKKDLTTADVMLMLSPSIPTLIPLAMSSFIEIITNATDFLKSCNGADNISVGLKNLGLIVDYVYPYVEYIFKNNLSVKTEKPNKNVNSKHDKRTICPFIPVKTNIKFMQVLFNYINDKQNNVKHKSTIVDIVNEDTNLIETEYFENIIIPYKNIEIILNDITFSYYESDDEKILRNFKINEIKKEKKECSGFIKLTDFIESESLKSYINDIVEKNIERIKKIFTIKENTFGHSLVQNIKNLCPNIDEYMFYVEYEIVDQIAQVISGRFLTNKLREYSNKHNKFYIFDTEIEIKTNLISQYYGIQSLIKDLITEDSLCNIDVSEIRWFSNSLELQGSDQNKINFFVNPMNRNNQDVLFDFVRMINETKMKVTNGKKIKIYDVKIDNTEIITNDDNPEYLEYQNKKEMLNQLENDDKNSKAIYIVEFLKEKPPPKYVTKITVSSNVIVKQVNEKFKPFDSVYLRQHDKEKLINVLDGFKEGKELFEEYGLPNKLGVLLYGLPGTGKTTTINAIASFLQKNIYYVHLNNIESNEQLQMVFDHVMLESANGGIIVFEDIDVMTKVVHRRDITQHQNEKLTLDYFLNLLQGSLTRDGTIFIATTNNVDILDEAFVRDGRFDIKINMKACDHYQIGEIYKKFIKKPIDEDVLKLIPTDKYTPANLIFRLVSFIRSKESCAEIMAPFCNNDNLLSAIPI